MKEKEFVNWLTADGMKESSAWSRLKNCLRVCRFEGDLDTHYMRDRCKELLSRLEYSKFDERNNSPARHSIPISGNIYDGTATLRTAVRLYVDFLEKNPRGIPYRQTDRRNESGENPNLIMDNKDFAAAASKLITRFSNSFSDSDIQQLADAGCCKERFNCNFPILKEIHSGAGSDTALVDGYRRYYSDILVNRSGRRFIVSNDWYCTGKNGNRNLFSDWLFVKLAS